MSNGRFGHPNKAKATLSELGEGVREEAEVLQDLECRVHEALQPRKENA